MCCFAQPVVSVTDTNIFARLLPDGWQYLVYQMSFKSKTKNAMVLPLPVALPATDDKTLEFISLEDYEHFFDDLNDGFPLAPPPPSHSFGTVDSAEPVPEQDLEVHEVGAFVASFVPSVADFDRLDERFRIPKSSWDKIPQYGDYGFAVFQLKDLEGKPHPMAFKFRSRLDKGDERAVFFPTVHIHDGEIHAREDFDHTLFLQAPEFDEACGDYQQRERLVADRATGYVRSKWPAAKFCDIDKSQNIVNGNLLVHRLGMHGQLKNADIFASLNADDLKQSSWLSPSGGPMIVAGLGVVGGLTWFFGRRDRVARESAAN